jgi:c-di-GMP-binding flagellar brake protein YcgR
MNFFPFVDRRRAKRHQVKWDASLQCVFPGSETALPVKVEDISPTGARLHLERLQIGSYHLVIGDHLISNELSIPLPEGLIRATIEIKWFNWCEENHVFIVGVDFQGMDEESRSTLERALSNL